MDMIYIGTCPLCGGYGQVLANPTDEEVCHIPLDEILTSENSQAVEDMEAS